MDVEPGFPAFEHNQWTFEGQMERWGAFARGASRATGWRRYAARVMATLVLLPFALVAVVWVVRLLTP